MFPLDILEGFTRAHLFLTLFSSPSRRSMLHILEGFRPDEYAHDPIDAAVVAVLRDEQAVAPTTRPPLSDLAYRPQADDAMLLKVWNRRGG